MDSLKTPVSFYWPRNVKNITNNENQLLGQGLPCHVTKVISSCIVEVQFDVQAPPYTFPTVKIPVATPEYARIPVQEGDKGVASAADAYLGGVTGLGGGTADLTRRANLTPLYFHPLANTAWFDVDKNAYVIYGPNGVVLMDKDKKTVFTLTKDGIKITLQDGDKVEIDGDLLVTGTITSNTQEVASGIHLTTHTHSGVATGSGTSGPPVAGSLRVEAAPERDG